RESSRAGVAERDTACASDPRVTRGTTRRGPDSARAPIAVAVAQPDDSRGFTGDGRAGREWPGKCHPLAGAGGRVVTAGAGVSRAHRGATPPTIRDDRGGKAVPVHACRRQCRRAHVADSQVSILRSSTDPGAGCDGAGNGGCRAAAVAGARTCGDPGSKVAGLAPRLVAGSRLVAAVAPAVC